jgi:uncharacterized membrane protein YqaE (UPF0057 family)
MLDLIRLVFAVILPPVGVLLKEGLGLHFWINIVLTLLGYFPGVIHAFWVILMKDNVVVVKQDAPDQTDAK